MSLRFSYGRHGPSAYPNSLYIGNDNLLVKFAKVFFLVLEYYSLSMVKTNNICYIYHPMIILNMWNSLLDMPPAKSEFTVLLTPHWFSDIITVCDIHVSLSFRAEVIM